MKELTELDGMVALHQVVHEHTLSAVETAEIRDMYAASYVRDLRQLKELMKGFGIKEKS